MPDRTRMEQIEHRLEQSRRLLRGASDPITTERIGKLIDELERERIEENQK